MSDFRNSSVKSKYYDDSNKLVVGIMKNETAGVKRSQECSQDLNQPLQDIAQNFDDKTIIMTLTSLS